MQKLFSIFIIISWTFTQDINVCIIDTKEAVKVEIVGYAILYSSEARYQFGPENSPLIIENRRDHFVIYSSGKIKRQLKFSNDVIIKAQKPGHYMIINSEYKETGAVRLHLNENSDTEFIIKKDFEEYIEYVTYHEIFTNRSSDFEAMKAQSVAARTYAAKMLGKYGHFDVYSDTRDQVYRSNVKLPKLLKKAVRSTRNQVLTYKNKIILSKYCANLGGIREELPYLDKTNNLNINIKNQNKLGHLSKYYRWVYSFTINEIVNKLMKRGIKLNLDTLIDNQIRFKINKRSKAGRVSELEIIVNNETVVVLEKLNIRKFFSTKGRILPSNLFIIERKSPASIKITGGGHGHGIGMGQWEAIELSRNNFPYTEILSLFYPKTKLSEIVW